MSILYTREKLGVYKPKALLVVVAICDLEQEPGTAREALMDPAWKSAMDLEYKALLNNNTWDLVPYGEYCDKQMGLQSQTSC